MDLNPSADQATLEAIAELVRQHVGQEMYGEFLPWSRKLSRDGRHKFLQEMRRFTIHTVIPIDRVGQPNHDLPRKAGEVVAYAAVALWKLEELIEAIRRDD